MEIYFKSHPLKILLYFCVVLCFLCTSIATVSLSTDNAFGSTAPSQQSNESSRGETSGTRSKESKEDRHPGALYDSQIDHLTSGASPSNTMVENSHPQPSGKKMFKRSAGFTALRGKKELNDEIFESLEDNDIENESISSEDHRIPVHEVEDKDRKDLSDNELRDSFKLDLYDRLVEDPELKRASSFFHMRGKKDSFDSGGELIDDLSKKPSSGFMPMRGRKLYDDPDFVDVTMENDKRGMSFMPMRGKKVIDSEDLVQKRPSAFFPMRGRRSDYSGATEDDQSMAKRRSSFVPMRGRKSQSMTEDRQDDLDKRSGAGRKADLDDLSRFFYRPYPYIFPGLGSSLLTSSPYADKRKAFHALRGKKGPYRISWDSSKRAFYASRGKRAGDSRLNGVEDSVSGGSSTGSSVVESKGLRVKRSAYNNPMHHKSRTVAFKRPRTFYATRGKRVDNSLYQPVSIYTG